MLESRKIKTGHSFSPNRHQRGPRLSARTLVPDNTPTRLKFRVWLEAGQTPCFIFPNGPYESRASVVTINKRYKDQFKGPIGTSGVGRAHILREGKLPHIRMHLHILPHHVILHFKPFDPGGNPFRGIRDEPLFQFDEAPCGPTSASFLSVHFPPLPRTPL
jgi:hypothetical protein